MAQNLQTVRQILLSVCLLTLIGPGFGQEVTVINNFPEKRAEQNPEDYVLKRVTQHTYVVNEYEPAQSSLRARVMQLISFNLRSHTDNRYFSEKNRIRGLEPGADFTEAAAAMVRNALWIHDLDFQDKFKAFSDAVREKADNLYDADGYSLDSQPGSGLDGRTKTAELYTFQRMVYDLKLTMEAEVSSFLDRWFEEDADTPVEILPLPDSDAPPLEPLDVKMDRIPDADLALDALVPSIPPDLEATSRPLSRRERRRRERQQPAFGAEMVELLRENNKILADYGSRFGDMQAQIDAERDQRTESMELVREEVKALRELIKRTLTVTSDPARTGLSSAGAATSVEIIFDRNAYELAPGHKALLNRTELMLRNAPTARAVITGFADRTGSPDYNAWISEKRAAAVSNYLIERGISPERLTVTYVGDTVSDAPNPADRKVEVRVE